ncbi:3620_t:CDS:1, partial [Scutellospora calospora]
TSAYNSDNKLGLSTTYLNELYLSCNIILILLHNSFWQLIKLSNSLLIPYCRVLNKLQSDTAHLYE